MVEASIRVRERQNPIANVSKQSIKSNDLFGGVEAVLFFTFTAISIMRRFN
jgi:hypothetical protein